MKEPGLPDIPLQDTPGFLLRCAHQRSRQIFDELIGSHTGLSRQQVAVMMGLYRNRNVTQTELAQSSGFDRNTLAELMNRLVRRGLVARRRSADDARAYDVSLTPAGQTLLESLFPKMRQVQTQILAPLPAKLRPMFLHCLRILADSLSPSPLANALRSERRRPTRRTSKTKATRMTRQPLVNAGR